MLGISPRRAHVRTVSYETSSRRASSRASSKRGGIRPSLRNARRCRRSEHTRFFWLEKCGEVRSCVARLCGAFDPVSHPGATRGNDGLLPVVVPLTEPPKNPARVDVAALLDKRVFAQSLWGGLDERRHDCVLRKG